VDSLIASIVVYSQCVPHLIFGFFSLLLPVNCFILRAWRVWFLFLAGKESQEGSGTWFSDRSHLVKTKNLIKVLVIATTVQWTLMAVGYALTTDRPEYDARNASCTTLYVALFILAIFVGKCLFDQFFNSREIQFVNWATRKCIRQIMQVLPSTHQHINTLTHQHISTSTHQHINTSIHQHINTSTHQYINTSTHQHISTSTHQHINTSIHQHINTSIHQHINTPTHQHHINTSTQSSTHQHSHQHINTSTHLPFGKLSFCSLRAVGSVAKTSSCDCVVQGSTPGCGHDLCFSCSSVFFVFLCFFLSVLFSLCFFSVCLPHPKNNLEHINTSTHHDHINTSTHQHINTSTRHTSTHQHITHQHINNNINTYLNYHINLSTQCHQHLNTINTKPSTHQHTNTISHQYINTSTHQYINTSTHQYINTSIHQHQYINTVINTSTHNTSTRDSK